VKTLHELHHDYGAEFHLSMSRKRQDYVCRSRNGASPLPADISYESVPFPRFAIHASEPSEVAAADTSRLGEDGDGLVGDAIGLFIFSWSHGEPIRKVPYFGPLLHQRTLGGVFAFPAGRDPTLRLPNSRLVAMSQNGAVPALV
jgi:hypothetical protein